MKNRKRKKSKSGAKKRETQEKEEIWKPANRIKWDKEIRL